MPQCFDFQKGSAKNQTIWHSTFSVLILIIQYDTNLIINLSSEGWMLQVNLIKVQSLLLSNLKEKKKQNALEIFYNYSNF